MPKFVHGKVATKCLAQIRMKEPLIAAGTTTAESNGIKDTIALICEEVEAITRHKLQDEIEGDIVVARLANDVAESFGQEVRTKNG